MSETDYMSVPAARTRGRPALPGLCRRLCRLLLALLPMLLLGACARLPGHTPEPWGATPELKACVERFAAQDAAIARQHAGDGQSARMAGFAFLRSERPLASFVDAATTRAQRLAWLLRASHLDSRARTIEARRAGLAADDSAALDACRDALVAALADDGRAWPAVRAAARVADDYSTWRRTLGVYPVSARFVLAGVHRLQRDAMPRLLTTTPDGHGPVQVWRPQRVTPARQAPGPLARDALGIPNPDAATLDALLQQHAPSFAIAPASQADQPGAIVIDTQGPQVDRSAPVLYAGSSYTRFGSATLLQLDYTLWFPARPRAHALDLLGGAFDGVSWRVTLAEDGTVLAYDTMHACGCYHMFFPTARLRPRALADALEEPPWIPFTLPADWTSPPVLHLAPGTHYLLGVSADVIGAARPLPLAAVDTLREPPGSRPGGARFYDEHGIVRASRRAERWVLWPMGIRAPGAMRQRGRHATAFVGRRHFDDAWLLERYFESASVAR